MNAKITLVALAALCCVQVLAAATVPGSSGSVSALNEFELIVRKEAALGEFERRGELGERLIASCYNAYYYIKNVGVNSIALPGQFAEVSKQLEQGLAACDLEADQLVQESCRAQERKKARSERIALVLQGARLVVQGVYGLLCVLKCIGGI